MIRKIIGFVAVLMLATQVALASPVVIDIKPKEITKDPIVKEYASALWEGFKDDPDFIPVINGEGMPRIVLNIDAMTIPDGANSKEERFAYGIVLAVDLQGDDMPVILTQSVGIGTKKGIKKLGQEQAEQIKEALRGMKGIMETLQKYTK